MPWGDATGPACSSHWPNKSIGARGCRSPGLPLSVIAQNVPLVEPSCQDQGWWTMLSLMRQTAMAARAVVRFLNGPCGAERLAARGINRGLNYTTLSPLQTQMTRQKAW